MPSLSSFLQPCDTFSRRHIGPSEAEQAAMLKMLGCASLEELTAQTIPANIRLKKPLALGATEQRPFGEHELLDALHGMAQANQVFRSFIGMGYHGCITPAVILRNILENPGWYTQYTPYQAEISQGRLEALLNFQTMVSDLTALPMANASLLDEGTAAAEAMAMCAGLCNNKEAAFFVSDQCHPQTIDVVRTRAEAWGITVHVGDVHSIDWAHTPLCGVLVQYPHTDGSLVCYKTFAEQAHQAQCKVVAACDLLSLALITPPGEWGADIAIGSAQRFGVPMGYGGPHAAFLATTDAYKRLMPGRIIGVSKDAHGNKAYRMAMQTREQHIRREKATSNICTAQALLAIMAAMYGTYHGPEGLRRIAQYVHNAACVLAEGLRRMGYTLRSDVFFDTVCVDVAPRKAQDILDQAHTHRINLRALNDHTVCIAFDETTTEVDIETLFNIFKPSEEVVPGNIDDMGFNLRTTFSAPFERTSAFMTHPVFNSHHSEHALLRYIHTLQGRDLSLTHSMIPLGSCTMKLNATSEMLPVSWPEFAHIHPFAPQDQALGYQMLFKSLERWLCEITGFAAASLQPNAGSQGEYAGLLAIRAYHASRNESARNVCLIPVSAHGTNPASAAMAGMRVVAVACDAQGNVDVEDLKEKARTHADVLAAFMITYPSTHGVFETAIEDICKIVHEHGGQVYLDGANMNAQVGLCRPGDYGADVCHLNLHKTFCIPHGGGGPGVGPIAVAQHLAPFLPGHSVVNMQEESRVGAVCSAPWGSASILPISWVYIALMGFEGLKKATQVAILNANYMVSQLETHYPVLYKGHKGRVAHEFILDVRPFKTSASIEAEDVAKRLMDFGFHAPTMSFPVSGTLMIEPTESESKEELDRFIDAMITIRKEIAAIESGAMDKTNNPLKNAPHTAHVVTGDTWDRPYSRQQAAYPCEWVRAHKFWPSVSRIDNVWGDRNLICTCPPVEAYV